LKVQEERLHGLDCLDCLDWLDWLDCLDGRDDLEQWQADIKARKQGQTDDHPQMRAIAQSDSDGAVLQKTVHGSAGAGKKTTPGFESQLGFDMKRTHRRLQVDGIEENAVVRIQQQKYTD
jgi:hypothetical protein